MTKVWVLANLKGGAGKTTTAVHLAVAALLNGMKVAIADTDIQNNQQSATEWSKVRGKPTPVVVPTSLHDLEVMVDKAREAELDLLVVDTAPNAGPAAKQAMSLADLVIVPVKPSWFDLAAVRHTIDLIRELNKPALLVMVEVDGRQGKNNENIRSALLLTGIPLATTQIKDRVAYKYAIPQGMAVQEYEPSGRAAADIRALLEEILSHEQQ